MGDRGGSCRHFQLLDEGLMLQATAGIPQLGLPRDAARTPMGFPKWESHRMQPGLSTIQVMLCAPYPPKEKTPLISSRIPMGKHSMLHSCQSSRLRGHSLTVGTVCAILFSHRRWCHLAAASPLGKSNAPLGTRSTCSHRCCLYLSLWLLTTVSFRFGAGEVGNRLREKLCLFSLILISSILIRVHCIGEGLWSNAEDIPTYI